MGSVIDETGKRYGILRVIQQAENNPKGQARWFCECDCGTKKAITGVALRRGHHKSCGCVRDAKNGQRLKRGSRITLLMLAHFDDEDLL